MRCNDALLAGLLTTAISGAARIDLWVDSESLAVGLRNIAREVFDGAGTNQVDGAAAESAARHARADHFIEVASGFLQEVEFGAAHLVVVAHAFVGFVDQLAGLSQIVGPARGDETLHAIV